MRYLTSRSSGADVRTLQFFLRGKNLYRGAVDGEFGQRTLAAVIQFQRDHGLTDDGVVGPQTMATLLLAGMAAMPAPPEIDEPQEPAGLKPLLSNEQRMRRWGRFSFRPAPTDDDPEAIEITDDFEGHKITKVTCPVFKRAIRLHVAVAEDYLAFMQSVIAAKLQHLLLTFDGAFVPRYIRGSRTSLSNHAWGTAFDVNAGWNGLGQTPVFAGQHGSVRETVLLGVQHGWYWGGWFRRRDGMHFEHL